MVTLPTTPATMPQYPDDTDTSDFGYFASTEDEEFDLDEFAEPWGKYDESQKSHVFYPICIGEVLNQRYRIEHRVGYGGFSTVWMAHDRQTKKDVALKIIASGPGDPGEHEYNMQNAVLENVQDTSGLITYLDTFLLQGNERKHRVLVFPLRGQQLDDILVGKKTMSTRMSAARQLLETLECLHKSGIIHRDLNENNCMWGMASLENLSRDAKYKLLGRPLKQLIPHVKLWRQGEIVMPLKVPDNLCTETFYLGDFGLAMKAGSTVVPDGCPPHMYCSPDRFHNQTPSFACDMWSYMCIFAELYLGLTPFSTYGDGGIVGRIASCVGPLPKEWKGQYCHPDDSSDWWYDQDWKPEPNFDLAGLFQRARPDVDAIEREHALSVMTRGFSCFPEKRLTATQLLQDPSFKAIINKHCP